MGLSQLYLYAFYFVSYVITTVGYGSHSYSTSNELIYTCFLEVMSTLVQALSIAILASTLQINEYSFNTLLYQRLN